MPATPKSEQPAAKTTKEPVDYLAVVLEWLSARRGQEFTKSALVASVPGRSESIAKAAETLYVDGLIESKAGARKNSIVYWMPEEVEDDLI
jgi:hypothetical protein